MSGGGRGGARATRTHLGLTHELGLVGALLGELVLEVCEGLAGVVELLGLVLDGAELLDAGADVLLDGNERGGLLLEVADLGVVGGNGAAILGDGDGHVGDLALEAVG